VLELTNSKAFLYLWIHADGSLGLRLEKMTEPPKKAPAKKNEK
jgi:hypothetical protein